METVCREPPGLSAELRNLSWDVEGGLSSVLCSSWRCRVGSPGPGAHWNDPVEMHGFGRHRADAQLAWVGPGLLDAP